MYVTLERLFIQLCVIDLPAIQAVSETSSSNVLHLRESATDNVHSYCRDSKDKVSNSNLISWICTYSCCFIYIVLSVSI